MSARMTVALAAERERAGARSDAGGSGIRLLGESGAIARLRAEIAAIARAGFRAVLVQGESGVGKELVAESLRRGSPRVAAPYEVFDCPAIPEDHLESELFGTVRGAFPGAVDKRGTLERVHGGTVFFDEIAAMRREHQAKVLRTIEGKDFRRVGGSCGISVDVAVIAAAHENLATLVARGSFRHDLYYRLIRDGILVIPPLRERREDIVVLARDYALRKGARIEPAALGRLATYHWPGNVRQLQTALRVALRLEHNVLSIAAVEEALRRFVPPTASAATGAADPAVEGPAPTAEDVRLGDFHAITARAQRRALLRAFDAAGGNKTAAGILLGFHLSPGETAEPHTPLSEARRNLALRKFRYWCGRLGISGTLTRRLPATAGRELGAGRPAAGSEGRDP
jgi:two-component system, NtrC family, response regulator PilR